MVLFFHIGMRLSGLVFLVGIALIWSGVSTFGLAIKTKDKPTAITAAQLSISGPPKDNAFVHVTNYSVNTRYIVMTREHATAGESWSGVWLQIQPSDNSAAQRGKPIILKDEHIKTEADLIDFIKYSAFDAVVSDGTTSPPATPPGMPFPTINEKQDVILEMKARPDFAYALGLTLIGVLCCVGGVIPAYLSGRRARMVNAGNAGINTRKL